MVRVTFCLTSLLVGGTELNAVRTAEGLDRRRFHLTVVALSGEGPLLERYERAGIKVRLFETPSFYDVRTVPQAWRLSQFLKENGTQVLHAHSIYANVFGVPAAMAAGVPCVISSRRWWKRGVSRPLLAGNRIANRLAHRVLTNSEGVARLVTEEEGIAPEKISVIPNFVDEEGFERPSEPVMAKLRADLGLTEGQNVLGIVARLASVKDHATLLDAFARVHDAHPEWVLAIAGDGDERASLEERAKDLGVDHAVRFAGMMPHQPSPHHAFDVSILSSVSEGFPNSVVEAMAARKAVVATNVGGVPDAVDDGVTGLLVEAGDAAGMAAALDRLMGDEELRTGMGDEAFRQARQRFTRERVLEQLESLYHGVLGLGPTTA